MLVNLTSKGQGMNQAFGQNSIKHESFDWLFVSSEHFNCFYYGENEFLATYSINRAEAVLSQVETELGYRLSGKMEVVLYGSQTDFKQSNIGVEDQQFNSGGYTRIIDNKVAIYFDGDYVHLQQQVKKGIATVLLDEMMYGGSLQERVQNSTLMNLPVWFTEGLVSYLSNDWSVEMDDRMKDAIKWNKMSRFNILTYEEQVFAGHSIWKYLVDVEGKAIIANILYVVRLTRNFEDGLLFVMGDNFNQTYNKWIAYYEKLYSLDDDNRFLPEKPEEIPEKMAVLEYSELKISPDADNIAFVTNDRGLRHVIVHKTAGVKTYSVFKIGYRSFKPRDKEQYPLIDWTADSKKLIIAYDNAGKPVLRLQPIKSGKVKEFKLDELDQITSISSSKSSDKLILTAIKNGMSDLYIFDLNTEVLTQITKDIYTETTPQFTGGNSLILFASNKGVADTSGKYLLAPTTDIFIYHVKLKTTARLTNTPTVSETNPVEYTSIYYSYLADYNGIFNSYVLAKNGGDSTEPIPLTNYKRSILSQSVSSENGLVSELIFYNNEYKIYVSQISDEIETYSEELKLLPTAYKKTLTDSAFIRKQILQEDKVREEDNIKDEQEEDKKIVIRKEQKDTGRKEGEVYFQNPYPDDFETVEEEKEEEKEKTFERPVFNKYKLQFTPNYIVAQFDNSTVNSYYIPIDADRGRFNSNVITASTIIGVTDLFEDYSLEIGARMIGFFSGSDYWVSFTDSKHRVEKYASFFRKARFQDNAPLYSRAIINQGALGLKYPFSERSSIKLETFMREDNVITLSSDNVSLPVPNNQNGWVGLSSRYVFDNTVSTGINLYNGFKFTVYGELFNSVKGQYGNLVNAGLDFRHYLKVKRQIVWANRLSVNTSAGPSKVLYYLGGSENWINPKFNHDLGTAAGENYAFQAFMANLRGFRQNARNGNSVAVLNSELRIPLVQYLSKKPIKSQFVNNLMFVPFVDVGTAWVGNSPYSIDNPFNVKVIDRANLSIKNISQGNPFVTGYGLGVRTMILGYYLKYDMAWGKQQNSETERMSYFSIGLDF